MCACVCGCVRAVSICVWRQSTFYFRTVSVYKRRGRHQLSSLSNRQAVIASGRADVCDWLSGSVLYDRDIAIGHRVFETSGE